MACFADCRESIYLAAEGRKLADSKRISDANTLHRRQALTVREHEVLGTNSLGKPVYSSMALTADSIYIRAEKHLYRVKNVIN